MGSLQIKASGFALSGDFDGGIGFHLDPVPLFGCEDGLVFVPATNVSQKRLQTSKQTGDVTERYEFAKLWKKSKGAGVRIAIIDDGFNLEHEDLKHVRVAFAYDADEKNLDATSKTALDKHGTQVAGIIFAAHNDIGIDGVAPESDLIAIRQTTNVTSDTVLSFTVANLAKADIINCSWNSPVLLEPVYDVIKHLSEHGRNGQGSIIVFAAGNNEKHIEPPSIEASIPEVVTVGATQKYSNYGELVDIAFPSGILSTKGELWSFWRDFRYCSRCYRNDGIVFVAKQRGPFERTLGGG